MISLRHSVSFINTTTTTIILLRVGVNTHKPTAIVDTFLVLRPRSYDHSQGWNVITSDLDTVYNFTLRNELIVDPTY